MLTHNTSKQIPVLIHPHSLSDPASLTPTTFVHNFLRFRVYKKQNISDFDENSTAKQANTKASKAA